MSETYTGYFGQTQGRQLDETSIKEYARWFRSQVNVMKRLGVFPPVGNVLEIGSALGGFYAMLPQDAQASYTGLELDPEAVDVAERSFGSGKFFVADVESWNADTYQSVFCFEVLEHVRDPAGVLQHVFSLLKPGGVFVGSTPYPYAKNVHADPTHRYVLHPANWDRLFRQAGFEDVDLQPMSFIPFVWRLHPLLNRRLRFYVPFRGVISTTLFIARRSV